MALSEMEMRALEGSNYQHRIEARKKFNQRAKNANPPQPLPFPADEIPGGVDVRYQQDILAIVRNLQSMYGWDTATAFRGLSNIIEDVAAVNIG